MKMLVFGPQSHHRLRVKTWLAYGRPINNYNKKRKKHSAINYKYKLSNLDTLNLKS